MASAPRYPNIPSAMGTTFPVVTALLAALSAALAVVPLTVTETGKNLHFAAWTSDKAGTAFGSLSIILFVRATLAVVYAHAQTIEGMSDAALAEALKDLGTETEKGTQKTTWANGAKNAYTRARYFWTMGLCAISLTLGCIAIEKVWWVLPVTAVLALIIAFVGMSDNDFHPARRVVFFFTFLFCAYVAITQATGLHAYG